MERVALTLDDDLAGALSQYARKNHLNRDVAAERLLSDALAEWRRDRAVDRFAEGAVEFTRAAAMADVDPWRFAELLRERGIDAEATDWSDDGDVLDGSV